MMRVDSDETKDCDPDGIESDNECDGESKERRHHPRKREKYLLTFKNVENYIEPFNGDDGKNVKQQIKEFDVLQNYVDGTMFKRPYM